MGEQSVRTDLHILGLLAALLAGGCGGSGLRLSLIDASAQRPSNVAVYFTVDTSGGDPVAGLEATSFRIYEDGHLVSIHESKQTILNPEVAAAHYTLLLVDMSGSVTESGDVPTIVAAAASFGDKVGKYQTVGVYAFDGRREIVPIAGFTGSSRALRGSVDRLRTFRSRDPSTNLNGAVVQALGILDRRLARSRVPLRFGTLVVFTDGSDRAARVKKETLHNILDNSAHDVFVIGVGAEIDESELRAIGRSGAIMTKKRDEIASAFAQAADRIEAFSQRYYLLGYCSPARAGKHVVRIEASAGGKRGSLTYEFDARKFGPRCNPKKRPAFDVRRPKRARRSHR